MIMVKILCLGADKGGLLAGWSETVRQLLDMKRILFQTVKKESLNLKIFCLKVSKIFITGKRYQHCGVVLGDGSVVVTGGQVQFGFFDVW